MNSETELLATIQKVEIPPFLITRIEQKIRGNRTEMVTPRWVFAVGLSIIIVLFININLIKNYKTNGAEKSSLVQSMNLMDDHNLYK